MWHIRAMEHYPAVRRDEILPFAATCMDVERVEGAKHTAMERGFGEHTMRCTGDIL